MLVDENTHSNLMFSPPRDPMAMLLDAKLDTIASMDAAHARTLERKCEQEKQEEENLRAALSLQSEEDSAILNSELLAEEDFRIANQTLQEEIRTMKQQEEEDLRVASAAQEEEEKAALALKDQLSQDEQIARELHEQLVKDFHGLIIAGDVRSLEKMMDQGVDSSIASINGARHSPLQVAIKSNQLESFKALLAHNSAVDAHDASGNTALHTAAADTGKMIFLKLLLESDIKVDLRNNQNQTPFILAAKAGHSQAVELLLEKGAYIYHKDKNNKTAMQYVPFLSRSLKSKLESMMGWSLLECAKKGKGDQVMTLVERGASVFLSDECYRTALHHAAGAGHNIVVEYLLNHKADPDALDSEEQNPLHKAAAANSPAVFSTLLKFGANPTKLDAKGRTAAQMCTNTAKAQQIQELVSSWKVL